MLSYKMGEQGTEGIVERAEVPNIIGRESSLGKFKKALATAALTAALVSPGGCSNNSGSQEKGPIEPPSEQTTVLDDNVNLEGDRFFPDPNRDASSSVEEEEILGDTAIEKTFSTTVLYRGLELNPTEKFLGDLAKLYQNERGEIIQYPFYKVAEKTSQHYAGGIQRFAEDVQKKEADIVEWSPPTHSIWFDFEEPRQIPGIEIDPMNKESVEKALHKITEKYFGEGLSFEVNFILEEEGFLKVSFARTEKVGGLTVQHFGLIHEPHLVLDKQGNVVRGSISLLSLEEDGKAPLISPDELREDINRSDFAKTIAFLLENRDFAYLYNRTGDEGANISLNDFRLVLYVENVGQPSVTLNIISENPGIIVIEGEGHPASFYTRSTALSSKNIERRPRGYNTD